MLNYAIMLLQEKEACSLLFSKILHLTTVVWGAVTPYAPAKIDDLLNLVVSFDMIGAAIWIIWGTIVLASSLKDKNGPGLQSGTWQIVGGFMIMAATYLFKNMSSNTLLLNEVLDIGAKFSMFGGALWTIWGVFVLAGALKDKTGPALQSGIWQIVGGLLIMAASTMFNFVARQ